MGKPRQKFDTSKESKDDQVVLARKKFNVGDLVPFNPLTSTQKTFVQFYEDGYPLIVASGFAGTGKTMCSLSLAFREALEENKKVIIVRSMVQGRDMGFMPGDLNEKMAVFEPVYRGIISDIFKYNDPYDNLKKLGYLEFHSTSFLRGSTFDNAVVVVDEYQNMDYQELYSVITRIGENSRIILCGDVRQEDLGRGRNKLLTGANKLHDVVSKMDDDWAVSIEFGIDDIVRSGLVKQFIIADSKVSN